MKNHNFHNGLRNIYGNTKKCLELDKNQSSSNFDFKSGHGLTLYSIDLKILAVYFHTYTHRFRGWDRKYFEIKN